MRYNVDETESVVVSRLLKSLVVPRPIAWISTLSAQGQVNAAPFSFFNLMGDRPPVAAIGFGKPYDRHLKDTIDNIVQTGMFVINLVTADLADKMNRTSFELPAGISELDSAGLTTRRSLCVDAPHIAEAPVSLECTLHSQVETGPQQILVIGSIIALYVKDAVLKDAAKGYVDTAAYQPIARMGGSGIYLRPSDTFVMERPTALEK